MNLYRVQYLDNIIWNIVYIPTYEELSQMDINTLQDCGAYFCGGGGSRSNIYYLDIDIDYTFVNPSGGISNALHAIRQYKLDELLK